MVCILLDMNVDIFSNFIKFVHQLYVYIGCLFYCYVGLVVPIIRYLLIQWSVLQ